MNRDFDLYTAGKFIDWEKRLQINRFARVIEIKRLVEALESFKFFNEYSVAAVWKSVINAKTIR